jgi:hypothetical protein
LLLKELALTVFSHYFLLFFLSIPAAARKCSLTDRFGKMRPCANMCDEHEGLDTVLCFSMLTVATEQFIRVAQTIAVAHVVTMLAAASLLPPTTTGTPQGNTTGGPLIDACNRIAALFRKACGGMPARFANSANSFHNAAQIESEVLAKCVPFLHKIYTCVAVVSAMDCRDESADGAAAVLSAADTSPMTSASTDGTFASLSIALGLPSLVSLVVDTDPAATDAAASAATAADGPRASGLLRTALAWARHTCGPELSQALVPTMEGYADHNIDALRLRVLTPKHATDWGLVPLPEVFTDLYGIVRRRRCVRCEKCPRKHIAICMLCGAVMCAGDGGCRNAKHETPSNSDTRTDGTCTVHAAQCHGGQGVFFLVQENTVLLTTGAAGRRSCYYPSLYIGAGGEDVGRVYTGKHHQLYLARHRYEALGRMVATHNVGHVVSQTRSTLERVVRMGWF